jgi:hypothetical protein
MSWFAAAMTDGSEAMSWFAAAMTVGVMQADQCAACIMAKTVLM